MTLRGTLESLFTPGSLGVDAATFAGRLLSVMEEAVTRAPDSVDAQEAWALYRLYGQQLAYLTTQAESISSDGEGSTSQALAAKMTRVAGERDAAKVTFTTLTAAAAALPARRRSGSIPATFEP